MSEPNRTQAICHCLGWQGGTIHQIAQETGCDVDELLYAEKPSDQGINSDYSKGWFAAKTCRLTHIREVNLPKYKGNLDFWLGAAEGMKQKLMGN